MPGVTYEIIEFAGKPNLLRSLPKRLKGYAYWPAGDPIRVLVLVDRDRDDCHQLKQQLEDAATTAGLGTLSSADNDTAIVANRIAVEELEAWFFGDRNALANAFPNLPVGITDRAAYRLPDAIKGGTYEALDRELKRAGYAETDRRKRAIAERIAPYLSADANGSPSFNAFVDGLRRITTGISKDVSPKASPKPKSAPSAKRPER